MLEIPERIGPYRVLSVVGEGGMGVVYKAEDQRLARVVALKVIREFEGDSSRRRRFWQEARTAAQVAHPNACRIYDIAEEQGRLVLVMEFVEGESLAKRIERGPLPARETGQIALALLSALEAFHKVGIVHRDLKPSNIVLSNGGTKLLDFGIAKHVPLDTAEETATTLADATLPGIFLGTPRYASPEQFQGNPVDARSDLFSMGVILFEMLTGQPPFAGESFVEISHAVLHGSPPALSGSPAIAAMGRIVHRALARQPQDRYPNAEAMAQELRSTLLMDGIETKAQARALRRWCMTLGSMRCACALNSPIYCEKLMGCTAKLRAPFSLVAARDFWESSRKATKAGPLAGVRRGFALSSRVELPLPDVVTASELFLRK